MNRSRRQRGFSMIELMISLVLGLIMLGAIGAIYLSSKRTYSTTESLSRSQESARFANRFVARELRMAGYNTIYESGLVTKTLVFPAAGGMVAGQVVSGVENSGGSGSIQAGTDSITFRFTGNAAGPIRDCTGTTDNTALVKTAVLFVNDSNQLTCNVSPTPGTDQPLVDGIVDMELEYGIDTSGDRAADSYVNASGVTNWLQVVSVRVTLTVAGSNDITPGDTNVNRRTVESIVALRNQLP